MKYPLDEANFRITLKSHDGRDIMISTEDLKEAVETHFPGCKVEVKWTDNCQLCHGAKGGVPGNENIEADGKVACDYCSVKYRDKPWTVKEILEREG